MLLKEISIDMLFIKLEFRSQISFIFFYTKGIVTSVADKNEIDVYCVYCPQTDEYY